MVNWNIASEDAAKVTKVVARAATLYKAYMGNELKDRASLDMDITATHVNGCPLDLDKLLAFPDFDFTHDVFGIQRHIDRETGALRDCFLPRCSKPAAVNKDSLEEYKPLTAAQSNTAWDLANTYAIPGAGFTWSRIDARTVNVFVQAKDGTYKFVVGQRGALKTKKGEKVEA